MSLFHCDKPVVCKVHGFCVAGGTDMALCSDLLVIADDAKIGYPRRGCGAFPPLRCGPSASATRAPSGCSSPATSSTAARRSTGAWRSRPLPPTELDERFEELVARIARTPINQLVMMKQLLNQAPYAQGLHATQMLGTSSTASPATPRRAMRSAPRRGGRLAAGRGGAGRALRLDPACGPTLGASVMPCVRCRRGAPRPATAARPGS